MLCWPFEDGINDSLELTMEDVGLVWWLDVKEDATEHVDWLKGPGIWKGGFIVGVMYDLSSASGLTFNETLEFKLDSLEHVDMAELLVCIILNFWRLDVKEDAHEWVDWL